MDLTLHSLAIRLVFTALSLLLSWRFWRFSIRPRLNPDEPKELPSWIPFIGHAFSFFSSFNGAINKGKVYFAPSREPFAVTVAGQTIYVATSADDIGYVWKNSKSISLDPITMDMYILGGLSEKSRRVMFEKHASARYNSGNGRPLTPTEKVIDLHHQQLHKGPRLDDLMENKTIPSIFKALDSWVTDHRSDRAQESMLISLHDLCVHLFIAEETDAYFDPALLKNSPKLVNAFLDWEYCSWKFLFNLPNVFARDMVKTKKTITDAFADYYRQPKNEREESIYFVDALESMLREVGLTEDEMGHFTLLHYWAIVGNLYKLVFWLVAHLSQDQKLLGEIRKEVLPAVQTETGKIDETHLDEKCPKLESLVNETLRYTVTSSLARVILEPTVEEEQETGTR
ncbi:unnamed protein product [Periconia digitata]|uniref:Cytochrome P450 n=1 Tax=Periconia digitata TaxID=1303443 RepID=A0A9W4XI01_9PLEO|nr:unnamed protein product [Periconia digitata]